MHAKMELGDALFAMVNLARFLQADPAEELQRANTRCRRRFTARREEIERQGQPIHTCTLKDLDSVWEQVKKKAVKGEKKRLDIAWEMVQTHRLILNEKPLKIGLNAMWTTC